MPPVLDVPNYYATVRTDSQRVLRVVGKDYQIVQNRDAFSFFDSIVGGDGIQYETAGALGKGEKIFITAKLPSYIKVGKTDLLNSTYSFPPPTMASEVLQQHLLLSGLFVTTP